MKIPACPGIRDEIYHNEFLCKRYNNVLSAYDPEREVGGIFNFLQWQWVSFYPCTPDQHARNVAEAVEVVEESKPDPDSLN